MTELVIEYSYARVFIVLVRVGGALALVETWPLAELNAADRDDRLVNAGESGPFEMPAVMFEAIRSAIGVKGG